MPDLQRYPDLIQYCFPDSKSIWLNMRRERTNENKQFEETKTWIFNSYLIRHSIQGYRCKSGTVIFAWRVTNKAGCTWKLINIKMIKLQFPFKYTNIFVFKYTNIFVFKYTNIFVFKYTNIFVFKKLGIQSKLLFPIQKLNVLLKS